MDAPRTPDELSGLPLMLKVDEAAGVLRIGRTLAYELAARFQSGDPTGLPVIKLGGCLRVPRWALGELIRQGRVTSDLNAGVDAMLEVPAADEGMAAPARRRRATATGAQLSLLEQR